MTTKIVKKTIKQKPKVQKKVKSVTVNKTQETAVKTTNVKQSPKKLKSKIVSFSTAMHDGCQCSQHSCGSHQFIQSTQTQKKRVKKSSKKSSENVCQHCLIREILRLQSQRNDHNVHQNGGQCQFCSNTSSRKTSMKKKKKNQTTTKSISVTRGAAHNCTTCQKRLNKNSMSFHQFHQVMKKGTSGSKKSLKTTTTSLKKSQTGSTRRNARSNKQRRRTFIVDDDRRGQRTRTKTTQKRASQSNARRMIHKTKFNRSPQRYIHRTFFH